MEEQFQQQSQPQPPTPSQSQPQPQPNLQSSPKGNSSKIKIVAMIAILAIVASLLYYFVISKKFQKSPPKPQSQTSQENSSTQSAIPHGTQITNLIITKIDPKKGNYLIDKKGMTLYSFDKDTPGKSNCKDECLSIWPIFESPNPPPADLEGEIGIIKLPSGKYMYTYSNKPLYYYSKDKKQGDTNGESVEGWHLVRP